VTVVTAVQRGRPLGFTAQAFTSVSLEPPLVAMCPARTTASWSRMRAVGTFCANILTEDQEALCRAFATKGADKFRGVGWRRSHRTGSPVLADVLAWVDCVVEAEHEAGDHVIVVGRVVDLGLERHALPLLFYRGGYGRFQP
jgi:3-hydroxy-9,10-secoandrosta-1,3,5(10)-triene-9,17-dione monooxygenase reductase component